MLDTVVAVPLWVLLAGSALCLLIAILIAVYLRHTLHQSARFAGERGEHDTHEAAQALQIQLKEALVSLKAARHKVNESHRANRAKSAFFATESHEVRKPVSTIIGLEEMTEHKAMTQVDNAKTSASHTNNQQTL